MISAGGVLRWSVVLILRRWRLILPVIGGVMLWIGINNWWHQPQVGSGSYQGAGPSLQASNPPPLVVGPSTATAPSVTVVTPTVIGPPRTSAARSIPSNLPQIVPMPADDPLTATYVPPDPRYSPRIVPAELLPPPAPPIEQDDFATVVERRSPRR